MFFVFFSNIYLFELQNIESYQLKPTTIFYTWNTVDELEKAGEFFARVFKPISALLERSWTLHTDITWLKAPPDN